MIFEEGVLALVGVGGNAFPASDIDKGVIPCRMSFSGQGFDRGKLLMGIQKTPVSSCDIVINLNSRDA